MKAHDAIAVLQKNADALRARGVRHAALFGSVARGEARLDSDIDVMIELDPDAPIDVFAYVELSDSSRRCSIIALTSSTARRLDPSCKARP